MRTRRTFLVTGARAPATLEIIRRLGRAGHEVFAADCLRAPLGRFSRYVRRYFRVPAPRDGPGEFVDALRRVAVAEGVDVLLPTCEEIYSIGLHRDKLAGVCEVFCPGFDVLAALHHKGRFADFAQRLGDPVTAPESVTLADADILCRIARESRSWVFKPVYSRSASRTLIRPSTEEVCRLELDLANPWLAQRFVAGREVSSYGIAVHGRLVAHTLYHSRHRVGKAAGIYFSREENATARAFVKRVVARLDYTGQIGFDFMVCAATGRVYVLECNPRATSGVHLLGWGFDLDGAMRGDGPLKDTEPDRAPMVGAAMLTSGLGHALRAGGLAAWWGDFAAGRDVVFARDDPRPFFGQVAALLHLASLGWRRRTGLLAAATLDTEWNGSPCTGTLA